MLADLDPVLFALTGNWFSVDDPLLRTVATPGIRAKTWRTDQAKVETGWTVTAAVLSAEVGNLISTRFVAESKLRCAVERPGALLFPRR